MAPESATGSATDGVPTSRSSSGWIPVPKPKVVRSTRAGGAKFVGPSRPVHGCGLPGRLRPKPPLRYARKDRWERRNIFSGQTRRCAPSARTRPPRVEASALACATTGRVITSPTSNRLGSPSSSWRSSRTTTPSTRARSMARSSHGLAVASFPQSRRTQRTEDAHLVCRPGENRSARRGAAGPGRPGVRAGVGAAPAAGARALARKPTRRSGETPYRSASFEAIEGWTRRRRERPRDATSSSDLRLTTRREAPLPLNVRLAAATRALAPTTGR